MSVQVERRLFTVAEYHKMIEAGIFDEDDHVELIAGEIIRRAPMKSEHAACVQELTHLFIEGVGRLARVRVQCPIEVGEDWEPEPDIAVVLPRPHRYARQHPRADDILLLVEVGDTSSGYDRRVKAPQYARAGVPEVWLIDLERERIGVLRSPGPNGYTDIQWLRRGRRIAPLAIPSLVFEVADILGQANETP